MTHRSRIFPLSALPLVLFMATAHAGAQTRAGRILFQALAEKEGGLSIMDADGSNQKRLVPNGHAGTWSRDGCKILFSRGGSKDASIYVIDADGSNQKLVAHDVSTPPDGAEMRAYFSPDGRRIVFVSASNEIMVVNSDGSDARKLTNGGYSYEPSWSADGSKIHFFAIGGGRVVNADGTNLHAIRVGGPQADAQWSPDGKRIAFVSVNQGGSNIAIMNADGTNVRVLTSGSVRPLLPSWSPDGSKIVWQSFRNDDISIDVINADGSHRVTVADHVLFEMTGAIPPSWSPDGSRIAFTRMPFSVKELMAKGRDAYVNVKFDIYVVNADGSHLAALTTTGKALHPTWSPTPYCRTGH
jgi:Tol biopolymer transport system component